MHDIHAIVSAFKEFIQSYLIMSAPSLLVAFGSDCRLNVFSSLFSSFCVLEKGANARPSLTGFVEMLSLSGKGAWGHYPKEKFSMSRFAISEDSTFELDLAEIPVHTLGTERSIRAALVSRR